MLHVTPQGSANQDHKEMSQPYRGVCPQRDKRQVLARTWNEGDPVRCGGNGNRCSHCWDWRFLEKLKTKQTCDPAVPLPGVCPKELKSGPRETPHRCRRPGHGKTQVSTDRRAGKEVTAHTHDGTHLRREKETTLPLRRHGQTWRKPGTERPTLQGLAPASDPKRPNA